MKRLHLYVDAASMETNECEIISNCILNDDEVFWYCLYRLTDVPYSWHTIFEECFY